MFPVMDCKLKDEELIIEEVMEADDKMRFKEAQDCDHLMTSFQCD